MIALWNLALNFHRRKILHGTCKMLASISLSQKGSVGQSFEQTLELTRPESTDKYCQFSEEGCMMQVDWVLSGNFE